MQDELQLREQSNILKEIRDELRTSRTTNPFAGASTSITRPSSTFVQSQMMMDRAASGDWASLGWSHAYSSRFVSNWKMDLFASNGLMRSPNTMTQMEFQNISAQSLNNRVGNFIGGMISPHYTGVVSNLSQDIFENSQRFARFGDPMTGILGSGMSLGASNQLARQVVGLSYRDMRMSDKDYGQVVQTGLQTSQFDQIRSADEFVKKTKDLASAVGDLTRTLHLSVKEISESMGSLRLSGIVDVADQRRTLMHVQAAAQVGGLSIGQAMGAFQGGTDIGRQIGITAGVAGNLGVDNLARVREASRQGIIPQYTMAAGGGAEGVSNSITKAQLEWLTSPTGYMQILGNVGKTGPHDAMDDMLAGMREVTKGGKAGFRGILEAETRKQEIINTFSSDTNAVNQKFLDGIRKQVQIFGGKNIDLHGSYAHDLAYNILSSTSMTPEARLSYANTYFSDAGARANDRVNWSIKSAEEIQQRKLDLNQYSIDNTFQGQMQTGLKKIRSLPGQLSDYLYGEAMGNTQLGWFDNPVSIDLRSRQLGASSESVRVEDSLRSLSTKSQEAKKIGFGIVSDEGQRTKAALTGGFIYEAGMNAMSFARSQYGEWGMIPGMIFGVGATKATKAMGIAPDPESTMFSGEKARVYLDELSTYKKSGFVSSKDREAAKQKLLMEPWFQDELQNKGKRGTLNPDQTMNLMNQIHKSAESHGVSEGAMWSAYEDYTGKVDLPPNYDISKINTLTSENNVNKLAHVLFKGIKNMPDFHLADPTTAAMFRDILTPVDWTNPESVRRRAEADKMADKLGFDKDMRNAAIANSKAAIESSKQSYAGGGFMSFNASRPTLPAEYNAGDIDALLGNLVDAGANRARMSKYKTSFTVAGMYVGKDDPLREKLDNYGRENDIFGLLQDKDRELRSRLSAGSDTFREMYKAGSMNAWELTKLFIPGNKEADKMFGINNPTLAHIKQAYDHYDKDTLYAGAKRSPIEYMRMLFQEAILHNTQAKSEEKQAASLTEAQLFERTSRVLDELCTKLNIANGNGSSSSNNGNPHAQQ